MPHVAAGNVRLYVEECGSGYPLIFLHEFGSDYRQWADQLDFFSRHYRCIAFNARGYPPSDVPAEASAYGQDQAADDVAAVLSALNVARAHVIGVSMGAAAALHFGLRHPQMASALVITSAGSGAYPPTRAQFIAETLRAADLIDRDGMSAFADALAHGPTRIQLHRKRPATWEAFRHDLAEHSAVGSSLTLRNYQVKRVSLFDLEAALHALTVPVLLVVGDEDDPVLETNLFLKRTIPGAGLWVVPRTGHAVNLEEPAAYNQTLFEFFAKVERGEWTLRESATRSDRQFPIVPTASGSSDA